MAEAPPKARFVAHESASQTYARRANRIAVRNADDELVAVIEIVSPGNKSSTEAVRSFVAKGRELLDRGVNLLVVDLFPPSPRDPQGLHGELWDFDPEEPFTLPADKPLTVAAYAAATRTSYVEPVAVGDELPSLPIFLDDPNRYVPAPLETTYVRTWTECPEPVREAVAGENG